MNRGWQSWGFSELQNKSLRRDLVGIFNCLVGSCKENGARVYFEVCGIGMRGSWHKLMEEKCCLGIGEEKKE